MADTTRKIGMFRMDSRTGEFFIDYHMMGEKRLGVHTSITPKTLEPFVGLLKSEGEYRFYEVDDPMYTEAVSKAATMDRTDRILGAKMLLEYNGRPYVWRFNSEHGCHFARGLMTLYKDRLVRIYAQQRGVEKMGKTFTYYLPDIYNGD